MGNTCQPPAVGGKNGKAANAPSSAQPEQSKGGKNGGRKSVDFSSDTKPTSPMSTNSAGSSKSGASGLSQSERSTGSGSEHLVHSLHTRMPREQKERDIYKFYEVVEVLGVGSMGSVSRVRKRKEAVGGSARKASPTAQHKGPGGLLGGVFGKKTNAFELIRGKSSTGSGGTTSNTLSTHSIPSSEGKYEMQYALKSIHLQRISDPKFVEELRNEIDILRSLDHPNVVRPIETFEHRRQLCIVMELCSGGDLYTRDPYSEEDAQHIVKKILSAVAYMHRCGIMHRDLKYENILFENDSPDAEVKLVDFGLSKKYLPEAPHMYDGVGTIYTMAPQVLEGVYTSQADLWSCGVIAFMLLSSQMPFFGKKRRHVFEKIMKCHYSFKGRRWEGISTEAKDLVTALLQKDQESRPTAEESLKFPWLDDEFFDTHASADVVLASVQDSLERFSKYSKLKKLALMVVAHKSSSEEIGFLRDAFSKYDIEKNGTISYMEFKTALADFGYSEEDMKRMFEGVDLDGSGYIHYTEFLAATLEAKGVIVEERLAEAFDRLDSDDSGAISKENLKGLLADGFQGRKLSESLVNEVIADGDFFKDGCVSYEEFLMLWDEKEQAEEGRIKQDLGIKSFPSNLSGTSALESVGSDLTS